MTPQNITLPAFDTTLRPPKPHISEELPQAVAAYPGAHPTTVPARKTDGEPSALASPDVYQRHTPYAQWLRGDAAYTAGLVFMGLLALIAGFWRQIAAYVAAALAPSWGKFTGVCALICLVAAVYPWSAPLYISLQARGGRLMAQLKRFAFQAGKMAAMPDQMAALNTQLDTMIKEIVTQRKNIESMRDKTDWLPGKSE